MSGRNRQPYFTSNVLDQDFLDDCQDNLSNQLELIAELDVPSAAGFPNNKIYFSDRNKYVGEHYYEARTTFPEITKDIGEYLSPTVTFSSIKLRISNVDGKYNGFMPGGAAFDGMVNKNLVVKLGLRDVESTYITIFEGSVTEIGGFERSTSTFSIQARDKFDTMKQSLPTTSFTFASFPNIEDRFHGLNIPLIWGSWNTDVDQRIGASIPCFTVNGIDANVIAGTTNLDLIISSNVNQSFDNTSVVLVRGEDFWPIDSADITNISGDNNRFEIIQNGTTTIDGGAYTWEEGDEFFCKVIGKNIGASYSDNSIEIARDVLLNYGGVTSGDFSSNWSLLRDKNSPAESAIFSIKARLWVQNNIEAIRQALSLLEQVRCEAFINKEQKIDLSTLHFEDFVSSPTFVVRNWDVQRESFRPFLDFRNNINRTKGFYNFLPNLDDDIGRTNFFKNQDSITQLNKTVEKGLVFPNLYIRSDVDNQTKESLKLTSALGEKIEVSQTWRSLLLDISDFVSMDVKIGASIFDNVPCLIRSVGYKSKGMILTFRYWSLQQIPFPGYAGDGGGIVGGYNAVLTEET
jgi:hypothetical protein